MEKNKKVLIFSTAYYPFVGGAEVAVKEITGRLPDFEFDLITAKFDKKLPFKEKIGNVTVYRLGIGHPLIDKLILPFEGALFTHHLSKKKSYKAFWCIMVSFASGAAYIYNIFSSKKKPIILNLQEGDSERHFKTHWFGLINLSWKMALKRTQYLTTLSNYLKERALRFGYSGKVTVVPNGVDVSKFDFELDPNEKLKLRQEVGLEETDVALITASRLVEKNGVADVILAMPKLSPNIKFVICGAGKLEQELRSLTKKLSVSDRVIFLGNVSHQDLPKYLKACDIFIRPSLSEGFGNSFIEAMAARIPVIGTLVGGIEDFLEDGRTGYFCKPNDPESIAETVKRTLSDNRKEEIVENALRMVKERYTWGKVAEDMEMVFKKLIK